MAQQAFSKALAAGSHVDFPKASDLRVKSVAAKRVKHNIRLNSLPQSAEVFEYSQVRGICTSNHFFNVLGVHATLPRRMLSQAVWLCNWGDSLNTFFRSKHEGPSGKCPKPILLDCLQKEVLQLCILLEPV